MLYAWIITKDHLDPETDKQLAYGPSGADDEHLNALRQGEGVAFHMYDDDNELYFSGRFWGDAYSQDAFGPLDDYGMPDSGCTGIKYQCKDGKWRYL